MFKATLIIQNRTSGETEVHEIPEERAVGFLNRIEFSLEANSLNELQAIFGF